MPETKFTPGPWRADSCDLGVVTSWDVVHTRDGEEFSMLEYADEWDCKLIAAAPDLYAYAEMEERAARLRDLEHEAYEEHKDWPSYHEAIWKLRDEIMPEFASQCPATTTEEDLREWYGREWEDYTHADLRDYRYGDESFDSESSFSGLLHAKLTELRTAALAKARGESAP